MIRALARRLRALLALPGAVEAAVETAHLRAVVASQGASLLRRDAATAELMAERDDLRADVARLAALAARLRVQRDAWHNEADVARVQRDEALADLKLADEQTAEWCRQNNRHRAQWVQATEERDAARAEAAFQRGLYEAELVVSVELQTERDAALVDLAAARACIERLSAELRRPRG